MQFGHVGAVKEAHDVNRGADGIQDIVVRHGFACGGFHGELGNTVMHAARIVGVDRSQPARVAGIKCGQVIPRFVAAQLGQQDAVGFQPHTGSNNLCRTDARG